LTPLEEEIAQLIEPAVAGAGFDLVRVRVSGAQRKTLQVMAERADGTMSAEDCAALSRTLSPLLDAADPIKGAYTLEVSSPGIDRPLTRLEDFEAWSGFEAKVETSRPLDGRKRWRGVLNGVEGDQVRLNVDDGVARIPFAAISSARLVLTEDLVRKSLSAAKAAKRLQGDQR
jgi:ribosome maturation factor RimP